ncbi:MAG: SWIM zinc finger family protein [Planctomycetes bacterium]|nr:SWIM zinc finger family protein [Planctomycetota bacterium]
MWFRFRPYVPVAKRRAQAAKEMDKRRKKGEAISPVVIQGRTIAHTFWGKAWCENLESYSDYSNRLPRGRSYVRNGSVVNLQIEPGKIVAMVSGSSLYKIKVDIDPLPAKQWKRIKTECAGQIGSLVELLQGRLSQGVMDIVTAHGTGLFPKPSEIHMNCSCPDWAGLCKHLAAVLYGIGARLDQQPELLFVLRKVDHLELIEEAVPVVGKETAATKKKTLAVGDVADVFGIELAEGEPSDFAPVDEPSGKSKAARKAKGRRKKTPQPA